MANHVSIWNVGTSSSQYELMDMQNNRKGFSSSSKTRSKSYHIIGAPTTCTVFWKNCHWFTTNLNLLVHPKAVDQGKEYVVRLWHSFWPCPWSKLHRTILSTLLRSHHSEVTGWSVSLSSTAIITQWQNEKRPSISINTNPPGLELTAALSCIFPSASVIKTVGWAVEASAKLSILFQSVICFRETFVEPPQKKNSPPTSCFSGLEWSPEVNI